MTSMLDRCISPSVMDTNSSVNSSNGCMSLLRPASPHSNVMPLTTLSLCDPGDEMISPAWPRHLSQLSHVHVTPTRATQTRATPTRTTPVRKLSYSINRQQCRSVGSASNYPHMQGRCERLCAHRKSFAGMVICKFNSL